MSVVTVDLVAAARPNFMKVAPLYKAMMKDGGSMSPRLIHTGQHYDENMSGAFFRDLELPEPYVHLGVGSGSHAEQTGRVMIAYEDFCMKDRPDWTVVVGDVNSTMACALAAKKLLIPIAHLEAGLRSRDVTMPEEINRIVTDTIADLLWTHSEDADENLEREGVSKQRIHRVGNIMIDTLEMMRPKFELGGLRKKLGLEKKPYIVVTLHRPSNVDDRAKLEELTEMLVSIAGKLRLIFPVHPRTRERLLSYGLWESLNKARDISLLEPVGYVDFMSLVFQSSGVLTDSGGIQEETTYLGIPCLTLRSTTERPITVEIGTNRLVKPIDVLPSIERIIRKQWPRGRKPDLWDGKTAARVLASLGEAINQRCRA